MNLTDMKLTNLDLITINDSLKAPLLKLNVIPTSNVVAPSTNELIINVDKSSEETEERKTYVFNLSDTLKYLNDTSDEFTFSPVIDGEEVKLKAYVTRRIKDGAVLETEEIEEVEHDVITLFEGINYISTNYSGVTLNVVYPKNTDLVNYFLNTLIYANDLKNKVLSLDDIYYKDAFTETEDGINANLNELTIKCLSSKTGQFRLDSLGNLTVNSLINLNPSSTTSSLDFNAIYPVGSIYMSVSSVNPSTFFGGTWESIGAGKTLIGVDANDTDFNTVEKIGGAKTHTHILPRHRHVLSTGYAKWNGTTNKLEWQEGEISSWTRNMCLTGTLNYVSSSAKVSYGVKLAGYSDYSATTITTEDTSNLMPYLTCYMWKRTA